MRRAAVGAALVAAALAAPATAGAHAATRWLPVLGGHVPVAAQSRPGAQGATHSGRTHRRPQRGGKPAGHKPARPPKPPIPPVPPPPVSPPLPPPPAPRPLARLQVVAREFSLTLSRQALPSGAAAIELDNFGQDPHDLRVERVDDAATGFVFSLAKPRTVTSRRFELAAGDWKLFCTLPGHEQLGMSARITVVP